MKPYAILQKRLLDTKLLEKEIARRRNESLLKFISATYEDYKSGWVHHDICKRLEAFSENVRQKKSPRLMLFMPPRHGKSFIVSERFPVWHLGRNPADQIILVSYAQSLSDKFSKRARSIAHTDLVKQVFPKFKLDENRQAVQEWETELGGGFRSVGIGGGVTGMGANILIIDDPIKNSEEAYSKSKRENDWEWYQTTGYTRLMPGAGILMIMTRWHHDDLAGRLIEAMKNKEGDDWEIISYPAIAEVDEQHRKAGEALHGDRYDLTQLDKIKKAIGTKAWVSLYQQKPSLETGSLFKEKYWQEYTVLPTVVNKMIMSWDCTFKGESDNDYVVGGLIVQSGVNYYLVDVIRGQWDFVQTIENMNMMIEKYPEASPILIEDKANGPAIISALKSKIKQMLKPINPGGSKEARANAILPVLEGGHVFLPAKAAWKKDFIDECTAFPKGSHDDQVDVLTQAIIWLESEMQNLVFADLNQCFAGQDLVKVNDYALGDQNKEIFIGVRFGNEWCGHCMVAVDVDENIVGFKQVLSNNIETIQNSIVRFVERFKNIDIVMSYSDHGIGQNMDVWLQSLYMEKLIVEKNETNKHEIINTLKSLVNNGRTVLRIETLENELKSFKSKEKKTGELVYDGELEPSHSAVWAFGIAISTAIRYEKSLDVLIL